MTLGVVNFLKDEFFSGGETVVTDADEILLYQTARIRDFAYKFQSLVMGITSLTCMHFALNFSLCSYS